MLWSHDQELDVVHKMVLSVIAAFLNNRNGDCFPKMTTIAKKASVSVRTARRCVSNLRRDGWLITKPRWGTDGRRLSNTYALGRGFNGEDLVTRRRGVPANGGRVYNHNLNHNKIRQSDGSKRSRESAEYQEALSRLAGMLGDQGWEILTHFDREVPLLVGKYRRGVLRDEDLSNLILCYELEISSG